MESTTYVVVLKQLRLLSALAAVLCSAPGLLVASVTALETNILVRPLLKPAARDPFLLSNPVPAAARAPAPVFTPQPTVQAAPVTPSEPELHLGYIGRMQTPDGRNVVLAQWSDGRSVALEQGKVLPNGYRVERMSANMVELLHPQTQAMVQLPLPPAPRFETR